MFAPASADLKVEPYIITKVWYTYLGGARTTFAVERSLQELNKATLDCVLLHWPYCKEDIHWMNCAQEEEDLPEEVKRLGPAPHLEADKVKILVVKVAFYEGVGIVEGMEGELEGVGEALRGGENQTHRCVQFQL